MEQSDLDVPKCEQFLLIHSRVLHPAHAHMIDVKHSYLHLLGHSQGYLMSDLNDRQLQAREDIARMLIGIADKVLPGKNKNSVQKISPCYLVLG